MIRIVEEKLTGKWLNLIEILQAHGAEVEPAYLDRLMPDMDTYETMDATGSLLCLFMYDDDTLVGYSVNFIVPHLHYEGIIVCQNDSIYLNKLHRTGRNGIRLIEETEAQARKRGATVFILNAKPDTTMSRLLPKLDFKLFEITYKKEL